MTIDELKEVMKTKKPFDLKFNEQGRTTQGTYRFDSNQNIEIKCADGVFRKSNLFVNDMFEAEFIKIPWKPKNDGQYWSWWIDSRGNSVVVDCIFINCSSNLEQIAFGNCFETKEECRAHPEVRDMLLKMRKDYAE